MDGLWKGSVNLGDGDESLALDFFPEDSETGAAAGALVEMPSRGLFGYPAGELRSQPSNTSFSLLGDAPYSGIFKFDLASVAMTADGHFSINGTMRLKAGFETEAKDFGQGAFTLVYYGISGKESDEGETYAVDTGKGLLRGSFMPARNGEATESLVSPVALLLSGAQADRNGNNYSVPGRSDSLAQLARALSARGIASLRFDKRGTGESYRLSGGDSPLSFEDHVRDAEAALRGLAGNERFSSIIVVGQAEGALVGASALNELFSLHGFAKARVAGMVCLCSSGKSELENARESLAKAPDQLQPEAQAIMEAMLAGKGYPNPSPYFADYFNPSNQSYLASLFARDPKVELSKLDCPVLVIAGASDLQVSASESEILASSHPGSLYRVLPGMAHTLKEVGSDEEKNYASFTDPSLPLDEELPQLIADFAEGLPLPEAAAQKSPAAGLPEALSDPAVLGQEAPGQEESGMEAPGP